MNFRVCFIAIASATLLAPVSALAAEPSKSCESGTPAAELFSSGTRYEQEGLKGVALRCFDLARHANWNEYRYHRAYIRVAHQIGRQADIFKEYSELPADPAFEVSRLTLLSRLYEYEPNKFVDFASQAVRLDPENVWAANALGAGYDVLGKGELAIKTLEAAYTHFGKQPETALILANVLRNHGHLDNRVLDLLQEAMKDEYYKPYAVAFLGNYQIEMRRPKEGIETLQKNIATYPYFGLSYLFLGDYYSLKQHDFEHSKVLYTDAIVRNAADAIFYNIAAWNLLEIAKRRTEVLLAKELAAMAVQISGRKRATILDTLAEAEFKLGRKKEAVKINQEALTVASEDGEQELTHIKNQIKKFEASPDLLP
jgi:tetratricopeptide (TPR) repeat protein